MRTILGVWLGGVIQYLPIHLKIFPVYDWSWGAGAAHWAPAPAGLSSILATCENASSVRDLINSSLPQAWGCTYELITHAQANDLLTSWDLSVGGAETTEEYKWNIELAEDKLSGVFDQGVNDYEDYFEIASGPLIRGFASNFTQFINNN